MKKIFAIATLFACTILSAQKNAFDFKVQDSDGRCVALSQYEGKVLLVVNTATKCGFTPQYKELQALYDDCKDKGFESLDFPCNQFGGQAPGSMQEIREFCTEKYSTTFPQFNKIDVNGENADEFWVWLYTVKPFEGFGKGVSASMMDKMMKRRDPDYASNPDIKWNFTKFLINRKGEIVARFEPVADMKEVRKAVEEQL